MGRTGARNISAWRGTETKILSTARLSNEKRDTEPRRTAGSLRGALVQSEKRAGTGQGKEEEEKIFKKEK